MVKKIILFLLITSIPSILYAAPSKKTFPKKHITVFIDPGHGGKDYGALSEGHGYEEKQLTLTTSFIIKNYLQKLGYDVHMTRSQDIFVPLQSRANMANEYSAAIFVSIHFNFSPNPTAHGIEVFYCQDQESSKERMVQSKKLAEELLARTTKHTGATSRGVKTANFVVIKQTEMPAVLIEGGFLSNKEERQKIKDPRYLNFIGWGVARGIDHYLSNLK